MDRRNFFKLTGTCTGGLLLVPDFLYSYASQAVGAAESCIVFIQLNGGNDGLNTFIPYTDDLYYHYRPAIAIPKTEVIPSGKGMGLHPVMRGFAAIQQKGDLSIIQNVGYPEPVRSHFRSQEIWQTGSASNQYLDEGWLGRFLDIHCKDHQPTASINIDSIDNLALRGIQPNTITVKDPRRFSSEAPSVSPVPSGNPQLDFARRIAGSVSEGATAISDALEKAPGSDAGYPKTGLGRNMQWIARLIKGRLNSNVYYTSLNGFDTHDAQVNVQQAKLEELDGAVLSFYNDIKSAGKLSEVTVVIFSEFGRRVADNGRGTDHGTAAPVFIIGGGNSGGIMGSNPNLEKLDNGDLIYETDFRSLYATLLRSKFNFDPSLIGINNTSVSGLFNR